MELTTNKACFSDNISHWGRELDCRGIEQLSSFLFTQKVPVTNADGWGYVSHHRYM